jgi:exonuclease SbcC
LIASTQEIISSKSEIEKYTTIIQHAELSEKELTEKVTANKIATENIEKQIALLEENIRLVKTVQDLAEQRKTLKDGKACPLCGSTEHPYAQGNEPKIGEKETELFNIKNLFKEIGKSIQQDEKNIARLIADKNNSLENVKKEEQKLDENRQKRNNTLNEIKKLNAKIQAVDDENNTEALEEIRKKLQDEYLKIRTVITQAEHAEEQIKKLRDEIIPQFQNACELAEKTKNDADISRKLAEKNVETFLQLTQEAKAKHMVENKKLETEFATYEINSIEELKNCLTRWNENKISIEKLSEQTIALNHTIILINSEISNTQKQIAEKTIEKENLENDKTSLVVQRTVLFGNKIADEEEQRLKKMISEAEAAKLICEKEWNNAVTEHAKTTAIINDKAKELVQKGAENITEKTLAELDAELATKKAHSDKFWLKIGMNKQILKANDEKIKNNRQKLVEKAKQEKECNKWKLLDKLIGSPNGDKYRNYVQALTFENLIGFSNRQLQKMSERYMLVRISDATNPFELAVIDKFQNCDRRTAQNLSGGEKFIVALSLALGLANMASKNMKIDTMFIDEGFGALDADYLDVALTALSNLHSEGKLIGVISHLPELKERIATHIEVIPKGNGRSEIEIKS